MKIKIKIPLITFILFSCQPSKSTWTDERIMIVNLSCQVKEYQKLLNDSFRPDDKTWALKFCSCYADVVSAIVGFDEIELKNQKVDDFAVYRCNERLKEKTKSIFD